MFDSTVHIMILNEQFRLQIDVLVVDDSKSNRLGLVIDRDLSTKSSPRSLFAR